MVGSSGTADGQCAEWTGELRELISLHEFIRYHVTSERTGATRGAVWVSICAPHCGAWCLVTKSKVLSETDETVTPRSAIAIRHPTRSRSPSPRLPPSARHRPSASPSPFKAKRPIYSQTLRQSHERHKVARRLGLHSGARPRGSACECCSQAPVCLSGLLIRSRTHARPLSLSPSRSHN